MEAGQFSTRIRTGMGEELTLPNSLIPGNITRNYSRITQGRGYMLDITISCGYDTPWQPYWWQPRSAVYRRFRNPQSGAEGAVVSLAGRE